ncbi:hypothetical protein AN1V17_00770 [Vallitalea sediminicola]
MESIDMLIKQSTNTKERLLYSGIQLFSAKGYSNVGIRKLCISVGIKESSFYNHFKSKESLFREIMGLMISKGDEVLFTDEEVDMVVEKMSVDNFMKENLKRIQSAFTNPLFIAIMRLVVMESYINPVAYELSENNNYDNVRNATIKILKGYQEKGEVKACDIATVVDTYYHGLKTYNDTYILNDAWGKDQNDVVEAMKVFNQLYIDILKGELYEE